ncbi:MAG TPA: hypothetical protein VKR26_03910 [Terriglobales bacterium]|nr:hypothetical protein [Terriglobales bacterium]
MRSGVAGRVALLTVLLWSVNPASAAGFKQAMRGVRKYVIINLLLATADYESARAVQHPRGCMESNSLFSRYPSRPRFYGEGLAIDAGPELLGWILHRKHVRFWQAPFAAVTAWHGEGIISNLRCSGPHP